MVLCTFLSASIQAGLPSVCALKNASSGSTVAESLGLGVLVRVRGGTSVLAGGV